MMDWFRHYHGCAFDPKWRTIARRTGQTIERVTFVWDTLMEYASGNNRDRGSVHGWSAEIVADHLMCEVQAIERVRDEIERMGCIEDGRLAAWERRQPADPTAAERMRRYRERQKDQANQEVAKGCDTPDTGNDTGTDTGIGNGRDGELDRIVRNDNRNDRNQQRNERNVTALSEQTRTDKIITDSPACAGEGAAADAAGVGSDRAKPKSPTSKIEPSVEFEEFYAAYPRKVGKPAAAEKYRQARKRGATHAEIMIGLNAAITNWELKRTELQYVPHPATWLNHQRWKDHEPPPRRTGADYRFDPKRASIPG